MPRPFNYSNPTTRFASSFLHISFWLINNPGRRDTESEEATDKKLNEHSKVNNFRPPHRQDDNLFLFYRLRRPLTTLRAM